MTLGQAFPVKRKYFQPLGPHKGVGKMSFSSCNFFHFASLYTEGEDLASALNRGLFNKRGAGWNLSGRTRQASEGGGVS